MPLSRLCDSLAHDLPCCCYSYVLDALYCFVFYQYYVLVPVVLNFARRFFLSVWLLSTNVLIVFFCVKQDWRRLT